MYFFQVVLIPTMSHQSGIQAGPEARKAWERLRSPGTKVRLVKLRIKDAVIVPEGEWSAGSGGWEKDYQTLIPQAVKKDEPCFLFFRLDGTGMGSHFLFVTYNPDSAHIREKMLYSSSRATLKSDFGLSYIRDEYNPDSYDEVLFTGYSRYLKTQSAPAPLSAMEEMHEKNRHMESGARQPVMAKGGATIGFPLEPVAQEKLGQFQKGLYNYVQLGIDIPNERIKLHVADTLSGLEALCKVVPLDRPAYHLFRYAHKHHKTGNPVKPVCFIYSMPTQSCPIKEKMLYSSCRAQFLESIAPFVGELAAKIEVDGTEELPEVLHLHLYPPEHQLREIVKPTGPKGRGPRRLLR